MSSENENPFERSNLLMLSPPDATDVTEANCQACHEPDNQDMVACDICNSWYHFLCVNVTKSISEHDWICNQCQSAEINPQLKKLNPTKDVLEPCEPVIPTNQARSRKGTHSVHSKSSKKSSKKSIRYRLELKRLEEERHLELKFIAKRYELLEQELISEESSNDGTSISDKSHKMERVKHWITDTSNQNQNDISSDVLAISKPNEIPNPSSVASYNKPKPNVTFKGDRQPAVSRDPEEPSTSALRQPHLKSSNVAAVSEPDQGVLRREYSHTNTERDCIEVGAAQRQKQTIPRLSANQIAVRQVVPKELPEFNGDPSDWPMFISNFNQTTERCGFSNDENLVRLQRSLKGKAMQAVKCQLLLPEGVPQVMRTLRMLFGRPELILTTLINKAKLEPRVKEERLDMLIHLALSVKNLCVTIEASEMSDHLNNPVLIQELVEKLPASFKLNWAMHRMNSPRVTLSTFSKWLYELAEAASTVTSTFSVITKPEEMKFCRADPKREHLHAAHTEERDVQESQKRISDNQPQYTCSICDSFHKSVDCSRLKDLTPSKRWEIIREKRLCRRCFGKHHVLECKSKRRCQINGCKFKHHPMLHDADQHETGEKQPNNNTETTVASTISIHHPREQKILFRVIPVVLYGINTSLRTFAFLDEGSSLTLLDKELAEELQLQGPQENLCLKWTGDTTRQEDGSRRVSLQKVRNSAYSTCIQ